MVSKKEHTQSRSLQGKGGGRVTRRQRAKGEIKEDIGYISSAEDVQRKRVSEEVEAER